MARSKQGGTLLITEKAVKKATGLGWQDWFSILDDMHWKEKGRALIEGTLYDVYGLSEWWLQCVLVRYEHERGLR